MAVVTWFKQEYPSGSTAFPGRPEPLLPAWEGRPTAGVPRLEPSRLGHGCRLSWTGSTPAMRRSSGQWLTRSSPRDLAFQGKVLATRRTVCEDNTTLPECVPPEMPPTSPPPDASRVRFALTRPALLLRLTC